LVCSPGASSAGTSPRSLHDALPIWGAGRAGGPTEDPGGADAGEEHPVETGVPRPDRSVAFIVGHHHHVPSEPRVQPAAPAGFGQDRKSTRLNSSHVSISYAVFCLK